MPIITRRFILFFMAITQYCFGQPFDSSKYIISIDSSAEANQYFKRDARWLGADGAAAIDLGKGKLLWLFSDSFISTDTSRSRRNAVMIRNSIAIQEGYGLQQSIPKFTWGQDKNVPRDFFFFFF